MTTIGLILIVLASLAGLVGSVWLIIEAFRVELKWGLIALFVPFGALVFIFAHWNEAKKPFLVSLAAVVLIPLGMIAMVSGAVSQAGAAFEQAAVQAAAARAPRTVKLDGPLAGPRPVASEPAQGNLAPLSEEAEPPEMPEESAAVSLVGSISRALRLPGATNESAGEIEPANVITFARVDEHVGETLYFVRANGRSFRGELVAVEGDELQVRRLLRGGSAVYPVSLSELSEVRPLP